MYECMCSDLEEYEEHEQTLSLFSDNCRIISLIMQVI